MLCTATGLTHGPVAFKRKEMKPLSEDQINAIVDWMNLWEQLEGGAIPIRFRQAFTKHGSSKPPLGLTPKFIVEEMRKGEIMAAIVRYQKAGLKIPQEWTSEFCKIATND